MDGDGTDLAWQIARRTVSKDTPGLEESPEEFLAVLVPPDAVDWLDTAVAAVQDCVLPPDPVLRDGDP